MTPYYSDDLVALFHGDCREVPTPRPCLTVTDPPYNVGYHYDEYADRLSDADYASLLGVIRMPCVLIHYPEHGPMFSTLFRRQPDRMVAWVYHSNTPRQWRGIWWFGIKPEFSLVRQPYKNPTDKRIAKLIAEGRDGSALYDWWLIDQVKNVSAEKSEHPCQIPELVLSRILSITPEPVTVFDPFAGSGTTLAVAKRAGRKAIGVEMSERYCEIAANRLSQGSLAEMFQ
jgi:DNA modification methylase